MRATRGKPEATGQTGSGVRHLRLKLVLWLLLCSVPLYGALSMGWQGISLIPLAAYGAVSLLTLLLYWHDKRQARNGGQRIPEKILHALELAGGWPGALLAQQVFRHKTRKVSYQVLFWLIVVLHQVFWIDRLFLQGSLLALV